MASNCADAIIHSLEDNLVSLNLKTLKPLDEALRCRICYDYFNNCMITKCSHNYCSVCIRRHMTYKAQCPTCFQDASEPELRNNRLIDEILRLYKAVRENLQNIPQSKSQTEHAQNAETVNAVKIKKEPSSSNSKPEEQSKSTKDIKLDLKEVSCPVCYKTVSEDIINIHLDSCLKIQEKESERKTLPKLVYHLLTEKDIKKKLKEHGLNNNGDRQSLIRRHKNFITLYNANCDSLDPKPVSDLVIEIERQELEERVNSAPKQAQVHKKSDVSDIEKEYKSYVKQHQSQFNDLIHDIQQRHLGKNIVKQEISDSDTGQCGSQHSKVSEECTIISVKEPSSSGDSVSSHKTDKNSHQSGIKKGKPVANVKGVCPVETLDETLSTCKIKKGIPFSKSLEIIQDTCTNESPSLLEGLESGKIKDLGLLRKRKKGRSSIENRTNTKKK